jgi:hypothetical protein
MTQSAQTATLVARIPIVFFFMARSPHSRSSVPCNAGEPTHLNVTVVSAASFLDGEVKVPC